MTLEHLNPPELPDWSTLFSRVVVGEGSPLRIVAISGQVGVNEHQVIAGDGSFTAQVERAFANLVVALSAGRCSVADVAKVAIHVVGHEPGKIGAIRDAMKRPFRWPIPARMYPGWCSGAGQARV
ncbi:MAG: RidA family protein, partial [Candidatus Eiseniibacteriota bacterium]